MSERVANPPKKSCESGSTPFRIGVLLYFGDEEGRILLMERRRQPNQGLWCAVGGKLEMATGESPYECAIREAQEEIGVALKSSELALRCMLSEKEYKGCGHWLMFVFEVLRPLERLPERMEEGRFRFFEADELAEAAMPEMDRELLLDRILATNTDSLFFLRAEKGADTDSSLLVEEAMIESGQ